MLTNRLGQTLDLEEAAAAALAVEARDRECWHNSIRALRHVYRDNRRARYVEGHAVAGSTGIVTEHGWLEVAGRVVDPTPVWHLQVDPPPLYFPGIRYRRAELAHVQLGRGRLPVVHRSGWWRGPGAEAYRDAMYDAYATTFGWTRDEARLWLTLGQLPRAATG